MGLSVAEWLVNVGVAGIVVLLMATGVLVPGFIYKDLQRASEKKDDALSVERQRNADLQQMAATGAKALDALAQLAAEQRASREAVKPPPPAHDPPQSSIAAGQVAP